MNTLHEQANGLASLDAQRRALQAQMERQRPGIELALRNLTQARSETNSFPRSKTIRFVMDRFGGVDRRFGKELAMLVLTRVFARKSKVLTRKQI